MNYHHRLATQLENNIMSKDRIGKFRIYFQSKMILGKEFHLIDIMIKKYLK